MINNQTKGRLDTFPWIFIVNDVTSYVVWVRILTTCCDDDHLFRQEPLPYLFAVLPPLLEDWKEFQTPPLLVIPLPLRRQFRIARSFEKNWYGRPFTMNPPCFILISSFVAVRSRLLVVVVVALLLYVCWWKRRHFL